MIMHKKFFLWIVLLCAVQYVGCAVDIPRTVYKQEETIQQLQQSNLELTESIASLKKSQADLSNDIESLKQNLQALQGSIEQNNMKSERALAETRTLQQEVLSVLRAKEGQLGTVNAQIQSVDSGTQTPGAPPAQRPPNSISGNSIEGVWSPKPYQAQSQRKGTTPGTPGQGGSPQTAAVAQQSTAEWAYAEAYNTLKAGNYEGARKQFKQFLQDYKSSELAGNAQFWVGESFVKEKKYEEAIISFEDLVKSYPKSNKVPEGYYKQALCFLAINDSVAAKARLEMLLSEYPSGELADKAKQKLQELQQLPATDQEQ
jgi:tol-pal system protein YbgF